MTAGQKAYNWLIFGLVTLVLGTGSAALGYIVASSTNDADHVETEEVGLPDQRLSEEVRNALAVDTHTLQDFVDTTRFDSLLDRTLALYELFGNVDIGLLHDYWKQSQNLTTSIIRDEIQELIIQRWSILDPLSALDIVKRDTLDARQRSLFELVFQEWSLKNLENAINYVGNLDQEAKHRAVSSIVRAREDLSYMQRRDMARQLECEWIAIEVLRTTTDTVVIDTPVQEWTSFVWENKDDLQTLSESQNRMLAQLAYSWILQEGVIAFEKMRHSLPSDFSLLDTVTSVSSELIEVDPQFAFDLALAGTRQEKETAYLQLATDLIAQWAVTDARTAFDATAVVEARAFQLKLRQRVLWVWARHHPESLLNSIEELPESLQLKARKTAFTYIARQSPDNVRAMLSGIADRKYRNVIAETVVQSWALTDLASTLQWIDSDTSLAHTRHDLHRTAYYSLAKVNPQLAVQTALNQPLNAQNQGWEALIIVWTAKDNLDVAAGLLPVVRPGQTRSKAYNAVVDRAIDEQDWERAINLVVQYDEQTEQTLSTKVNTLAQEVPIQLYAVLESTGSASLRRNVARQLYVLHKETGKFSDEQLIHLEEISQTSIPKRPPQKRSARLQKAIDNFNKTLQEEESD